MESGDVSDFKTGYSCFSMFFSTSAWRFTPLYLLAQHRNRFRTVFSTSAADVSRSRSGPHWSCSGRSSAPIFVRTSPWSLIWDERVPVCTFDFSFGIPWYARQSTGWDWFSFPSDISSPFDWFVSCIPVLPSGRWGWISSLLNSTGASRISPRAFAPHWRDRLSSLCDSLFFSLLSSCAPPPDKILFPVGP